MMYLYILLSYLSEPTIGIFFLISNPILIINILRTHNQVINNINTCIERYEVLEINDLDLEMDTLDLEMDTID